MPSVDSTDVGGYAYVGGGVGGGGGGGGGGPRSPRAQPLRVPPSRQSSLLMSAHLPTSPIASCQSSALRPPSYASR